jgi:hypothetical protein
MLGAIRGNAEQSFYTVRQINVVWWFVDPAGRPFFSLGISDTQPGPQREEYDPQRPAYAAFRHYKTTDEWAEHTLKRLADWKFNTIGGWGHDALTRGPMPYTIVLHWGSRLGFPWNDIFHEQFALEIEAFARKDVAPRSNDRLLLGWFSDNELAWYADTLFEFHVTQPASSRTRRKLLEMVAEHYAGDFEAIKNDFEIIGARNFAELEAGGQLNILPSSRGSDVVARFTGALAEQYYKVVHDAIRRHDPNHLILGDRYAWHCPGAVAKAAAPYVDVISTNFDWPEAADGYLPTGYLRNLHRVTGRPVLITEYYVAAKENRSGNKNTGQIFLTVNTQQERAAVFEKRLRTLASQPGIVGAHWFRFADEPTYGRLSDGEDYNFGMVDIDDRPYEELIAAMTRGNADVPRLHAASASEDARIAGPITIPRVSMTAVELHRQLAKAKSLKVESKSLQLNDVLAAWDGERVLVAVLMSHFRQLKATPDANAPGSHKLELKIEVEGTNEPVFVRFGGKAKPATTRKGVEGRLSEKGLRHTLLVSIPSAAFGKSVLRANDRFTLKLALRDLLGQQLAAWHHDLVLGPGFEQPPDDEPASSQ